ncbi:hypothetical protein HKBW3S33_02202, partial [Candidatus Hakubella thermalkaliphila]
HPHQKVVGKKATFKIGLKEIKEKSLPPPWMTTLPAR